MNDADAVIVGAGPVGLFLAARLRNSGWRVLLIERRSRLPDDSRAIGIHPISLPILHRLGLRDELLQRAVAIRHAHVHWRKNQFSTLTLASNGPMPGVCLMPQNETIQLLASRAGTIIFDASFVRCDQQPECVRVRWQAASGDRHTCTAKWLIACDGHHSAVRTALDIPFSGTSYPDTYMMGDFPDTTPFASDAALWLGPDGLVESFPLPNAWRRWVVRTSALVPNPAPELVAAIVQQRTDIPLNAALARMTSTFQPEGRIADEIVHGRILLAGDAAHVVSPIGGQGMNLGWLNADALAERLIAGANPPQLNPWQRLARQRAVIARRRALFNMWLGRPAPAWLHAATLALVLKTPMRHHFVRAFTMRDLARDVSK